MAVAAFWLRLQFRRRWQPLLGLALLVALTSGVVLTAVAGARRGSSAVDRLSAVTRPADAVVIPNRPGFDWALVRALPEVEALTTFPGYTSLPVLEAPNDDFTSFIPADAAAMDAIERPVVLHGRRADPHATDEAVVTAAFVDSFHRGVGDVVTLQLMTPREADINAKTGAVVPSGPRVRVRIVGVVRSPWYMDVPGSVGNLIPSPGLVARYRGNLLGANGSVPTNGLVRLKSGSAAMAAFRADIARTSTLADVDVVDRADSTNRARKIIDFESACLLAVALAALLAAIIVLGQVVSRHTARDVAALRSLGGLGMTRRQSAWSAALGPLVAAAAGCAVGVAAATVSSRWMPFGAAAAWEPAPGIDVDWLVLGVGAVLIAGYVAVAAVATTWLRLAPGRGIRRRNSSSVVRAVATAGLPVPAVIGTQFALESGAGARTAAARPALIGAIAGVLGIIAAFTFSTGVDDAEHHPERFGQNYQVLAVLGCCGEDFVPAQKVLTAIANDPDVKGVTNLRAAVGTSNGRPIVTRTYDPVGTAVPLVLTSGTAPAGDHDVTLAPTTADQLHAHVGSTIALTGDRGVRSLHVSGIGFGVQTSTSSYDSGAWVSAQAYDQLFSGFQEHAGLVTVRSGSDADRALDRVQKAASAAGGQQVLFTPPFVPDQLAQIRDVRRLPAALGFVLIALAIAGVGQTLTAAVRTRAGEIAVLRTMGMTPRQARGVIGTQAIVFGAAALLAGIPLGLALGRTLWRITADIMPLQYRAPLPSTVLLLIGPGVIAGVLVLAALPGRRAARLRIAEVLRAE